jgi:excisionase family DNA binding protein
MVNNDNISNVDNDNAKSYNPIDSSMSKDERKSANMKNDRLLTVQELSSFLKVPKSYIYWLTHQKKIPHLKIHGHLRFRESAIDEWLKAQEVI